MISKAHVFLALAITTELISGCASLTDRRRHQYVFVQSTPPGAVIFDKDQNLGNTPALVRLRRQKTYNLKLEHLGQEKFISLDTRYSWNGSFWPNFAFFGLAPYAWGIDMGTGAAWDFVDPENVQFSKIGNLKPLRHRIAIIPPLTESFKLSDEIAQAWENKLKELYPHDQVISFKDSLILFQDNGYDYDERSNSNQDLRHVMTLLKADQTFFPDPKQSDENELHGELKDLGGNVLHKKKITEAQSYLSQKQKIVYISTGWRQFIPNTVGLEFSNTQISLTEEVQSYSGAETGRTSSWGQIYSYLQAVTLSQLQSPRLNQSRWRIMFTPGARFSYKTVFFPTFDKLANVEFDHLHIGAGIGPEFGYQSGQHYTYFKITALINYFQIDWNQPGGGHESMSIGRVGTLSELGYLYFFNNQTSIRLFSKGISLDTEMWNSVAQKVNPTIPKLTYSVDTYSGLAIGYTFDVSNPFSQK